MPKLSGLAAGLTSRGRAFLLVGMATLGSGLVLEQTDLVRVAVFSLAAPLAAMMFVGSTRLAISATRELSPARAVYGSPCRVTVTVGNLARLPCGRLFFEDHLPYELGGSPRFSVEALASGQRRSIAYTLRPPSRGRYRIGPLSVRISDPFGLCQLLRRFDETHELLVVPNAVALPAVSLGGEWSGDKQARPKFLTSAGQDDVTPRPYRRGDDLRRVHWRSTARLGELTVRREDQPWQPRAAVLIDTRTCAHEGGGAAASFESAVTALASIGRHLEGRGFGVRAVTDEGTAFRGPDGLLDALAGLGQSRGRRLSPGLAALAASPGESVSVVIAGRLFEEDLAALARSRPLVGHGIVILLDTWTWREVDQHSALRQAAAARAVDELRQLGYSVLRLRRGTDLASAWRGVGRVPAGRPGILQ